MATSARGIRPPSQQRSRAVMERLLKAGEEVLAEGGYEGFVVTEVCRRANVAVGSVYQRFENKDALVLEIHRRLLVRLQAREQDLAGSDTSAMHLGDALSLAVHGLADAMYSERGLLRAFMLRGAADPNIAGPGSTASQVVGAAFKAAVLARRDEIEHPDPELAADIAYRIVYDVLARQVMYGPTFESTTNIAWSDLVDQLIVAAFVFLRHGTALADIDPPIRATPPKSARQARRRLPRKPRKEP
jgi:AcrR family transcriptional regulator